MRFNSSHLFVKAGAVVSLALSTLAAGGAAQATVSALATSARTQLPPECEMTTQNYGHTGLGRCAERGPNIAYRLVASVCGACTCHEERGRWEYWPAWSIVDRGSMWVKPLWMQSAMSPAGKSELLSAANALRCGKNQKSSKQASVGPHTEVANPTSRTIQLQIRK